MAYPKTKPFNAIPLTVIIDDVSTAGQVYIAPGFRGRITEIYSVLNGAIGTANAGLTAKISGTAVTGGTITIAYSGSAAGDLDSCTPTGANDFTATDVIEVETDGASTNTIRVFLTIWVVPT